jgi:hypothetical protein
MDLRQDPDAYDVSGKLPKDGEPNYRYAADPAKACRFCRHFMPAALKKPWAGGACEIVAGAIRAVDTCDFWEPAGRRTREAAWDHYDMRCGQCGAALGDDGDGYAVLAKRAEAHERVCAAREVGDAKFPEPVDAWQTTEGEDEDEAAWPEAAWRHAEAAVDALHGAGWRPVTKQALRWQHPKLKGHEIEVAKNSWTHSIGGVVQHAGGHHQLAAHAKATTGLYRQVEAARDFEAKYDHD